MCRVFDAKGAEALRVDLGSIISGFKGLWCFDFKPRTVLYPHVGMYVKEQKDKCNIKHAHMGVHKQ